MVAFEAIVEDEAGNNEDEYCRAAYYCNDRAFGERAGACLAWSLRIVHGSAGICAVVGVVRVMAMGGVGGTGAVCIAAFERTADVLAVDIGIIRHAPFII